MLGADARSDSIPAIAQLLSIVLNRIENEEPKDTLAAISQGLSHETLKQEYSPAKETPSNTLENILGALYSKRAYLHGIENED